MDKLTKPRSIADLRASGYIPSNQNCPKCKNKLWIAVDMSDERISTVYKACPHCGYASGSRDTENKLHDLWDY